MGVVNKRKHSPRFKFDVALKALESGQMAETARSYGITTGQVSKWIARLKQTGETVFATAADKEKLDLQTRIAKLEQLVGKKEVELSLMKNFLDFHVPLNGK